MVVVVVVFVVQTRQVILPTQYCKNFPNIDNTPPAFQRPRRGVTTAVLYPHDANREGGGIRTRGGGRRRQYRQKAFHLLRSQPFIHMSPACHTVLLLPRYLLLL